MNILTLDGGGSKGVYTIGVLKELELMLNVPLHEHFDFIYGTSTGSIIASLIALGKPMPEVETLFFSMVRKIMIRPTPWGKSWMLNKKLKEVIGDKKFNEFKTGIAIVSTNYTDERPLIFKSDIKQAYKLKHSFDPGFGGTIRQAIMASCAAYPIFRKVNVKTTNQNNMLAMDGGFIGNNPILFAIADVVNALEISLDEAKFLSVGTGNFVERTPILGKLMHKLFLVPLLEKILKANANTTAISAKLLFKDIQLIRINDTFSEPQYGTNFIETSQKKLRLLNSLEDFLWCA